MWKKEKNSKKVKIYLIYPVLIMKYIAHSNNEFILKILNSRKTIKPFIFACHIHF